MAGDGTDRNCTKPQRFSARKNAGVVLRILRGEDIDLLSRELRIPAARIASWHDAFLNAGQHAIKKPRYEAHDSELACLRQKLGESTIDPELLCEKIARLEAGRSFGRRRSRR